MASSICTRRAKKTGNIPLILLKQPVTDDLTTPRPISIHGYRRSGNAENIDLYEKSDKKRKQISTLRFLKHSEFFLKNLFNFLNHIFWTILDFVSWILECIFEWKFKVKVCHQRRICQLQVIYVRYAILNVLFCTF